MAANGLSNAMRVGRQTVSLPLSAKLTDIEVSYVVEAVRNVLSTKSKGRRTDGLRARSRVQHANACLGT
jgi:hypothetical protein